MDCIDFFCVQLHIQKKTIPKYGLYFSEEVLGYLIDSHVLKKFQNDN